MKSKSILPFHPGALPRIFLWTVCVFWAAARPASLLPSTPADRAGRAGGVVRAEVVFQHGSKNGGAVHTRLVLRTLERLRGTFPDYFEMHVPGGEWGDITVADSRGAKMASEQAYVFFVEKRNGHLMPIDGPKGAASMNETEMKALRDTCADLPAGENFSEFTEEPISVSYAVTSSGLLETDGFRRFTEGDRNVKVPVIADVSTRPSGITEAEALTALQNALDAWEAVCTIQFDFQGTETFSQSAEDYDSSGGLVVRVQFHDNFNKISGGSNTLGFGGAGFIDDSGSGGILDGDPFNIITFGYVVLDHPKSSLENEVTLEEVLAHEIGHVLGLAHSSETNPEPDAVKSDALMYYLVHADGRGADPRTWDTDTVVKAYPANTPPYSFTRKFYAVSHPNATTLSNPKVNQVTLEGWDLNGDSLTLIPEGVDEINGSFSTSGNTVTYTPNGYFGDSTISDPTTFYNDLWYGRLSDGTNQSPPVEVWIIGFRSDSRPIGNPDGVPDSYMTTHYGSPDGSTAGADTDLDGFNTLEEFLMQTDPEDADSGLVLTQIGDGTITWLARRFDLFRIQTRSDLTTGNWTTVRLATQPDAAATVTADSLSVAAPGGALFYRVERVD